MQKIAFVMACMACECHELQGQSLLVQRQGEQLLPVEDGALPLFSDSSSEPLKAFMVLLLNLIPSAAFNPSCHRGRGLGSSCQVGYSARSGLITGGKKSINDYTSQKQWEKHYRQDAAPFEWLMDFQTLRPMIDHATGGIKTKQILHVGCGTSLLSEHIYDAGYRSIVNVDCSATAIELMIKRNRRRKMEWQVQDCTNMDFEDSSFDVALDKGVLDTFLDGPLAAPYLREVDRVLRPRGSFLCVSFSQARLDEIGDLLLDFIVWRKQKIGQHWAYMFRKAPFYDS